MKDMEQRDSKKLFSRSNLVIFGPLIAGVLSVEVIFGWNDGLIGVVMNIAPIIIGLLYCVAFIWFGKFLSGRTNWPLQILILAATAIVMVATAFSILIIFTAQDPSKEFSLFAPGQPAFMLILFFATLFTVLGMLTRIRKMF